MALPKSLELAKDYHGQVPCRGQRECGIRRAIHSGDTLIIPTAEVLSGMGFGVGTGVGNNVAQDQEGKPAQNSGGGGGGGGGGRVLSRPVAVVIASPRACA